MKKQGRQFISNEPDGFEVPDFLKANNQSTNSVTFNPHPKKIKHSLQSKNNAHSTKSRVKKWLAWILKFKFAYLLLTLVIGGYNMALKSDSKEFIQTQVNLIGEQPAKLVTLGMKWLDKVFKSATQLEFLRDKAMQLIAGKSVYLVAEEAAHESIQSHADQAHELLEYGNAALDKGEQILNNNDVSAFDSFIKSARVVLTKLKYWHQTTVAFAKGMLNEPEESTALLLKGLNQKIEKLINELEITVVNMEQKQQKSNST